MFERRWPSFGLIAHTVLFKRDLKKITQSDVIKAAQDEQEFDIFEIVVNPKNKEIAQKALASIDSEILLGTDNSTALCTILAIENQPPPKKMPEFVFHRSQTAKKIEVGMHELKALAKQGLTEKEIVKHFKTKRKIKLALGQVRELLSGQRKRNYVKGKKI